MKTPNVKDLKKRLSNAGKASKKRLLNSKKFVSKSLLKQPVKTFLAFLGILLVIIVIGNFIRKPDTDTTTEKAQPKQVETYNIGQAPRISVNAKIEKSGVVTVVAQTSGVVQALMCTEGETFTKGRTLVSLSTNYQGGNALSVQRQIAARNHQHTTETYDIQKDIINKQRDVANKSNDNTEELRKISEQSIDETKSLISVNESSLTIVDGLIETAEAATPQDESLILSLKQQKSGLINGLNAAKAGLRNAEYSTDRDNHPTELADLTRDLTIKQLELQEKALDLGKDISLFQLRLAQINESLMFPAAPFTGKIERVHVRVGQVVNPGQPIATISGDSETTTAVALVSKDIAENISKLEDSTVKVGTETISLKPVYVSTQPTNGQLFSVVYHIPDGSSEALTEGQVVSINIPVGYADTTSSIPFIPLDAIFQTQDETYVFVDEKGKAQSREVVLGNIFGGYVEITQGISSADTIILDRNVTSGEEVTQ